MPSESPDSHKYGGVNIGARLGPSMYATVKAICKRDDLTTSQLVRRALAALIEKDEIRPQPRRAPAKRTPRPAANPDAQAAAS